MSEISIQIRRVTERVKQYYTLFGFTYYTVMRPGRSVIRGSKRLGTDEIECVISESARGTSVGFYQLNSLQGLLYSIPLLLPLILHLLNLVNPLSAYITGTKSPFNLNLIKLFAGESVLNLKFVIIVVLIASIPFLLEMYNQKIRLANLKSHFSFYSRDAIWDTRELSPSMVALNSVKSAISHGFLLAILYF